MTVIGVVMMNVHIVNHMSVTGVRIVQTIQTTEMKMMVIQWAMTTRGEILTLNRRERMVGILKTQFTILIPRKTIPDTEVGVKKGTKEQRYGKKGESKIKSNLD